jgi:predicted RNA-binding protein YlqC (UPF0109 family)
VITTVPLIQAVLGRQTRIIDAFRRVITTVPLIQAVLGRQTRIIDAFK